MGKKNRRMVPQKKSSAADDDDDDDDDVYVSITAVAEALSTDSRRHALSLHKYCLSYDSIISDVKVKLDFLGGDDVVSEDGSRTVLLNKMHLCAQKNLTQTEWWPFTHCLFELQGCLTKDVQTTEDCAEASSAVDDDLSVEGNDDAYSSAKCICTLSGAVDFCASEHTSTTLQALTDCAKSETAKNWYNKSDTDARIASPVGESLWVKVDDEIYTTDGEETQVSLESWADQVLDAVCDAISDTYTGPTPANCESNRRH